MTSSGELAMKFAATHRPAPRSRRSSNVRVTSAMVLQGWQVAWRVIVVGEAERRKVSIVREQSGHGSVMIGFIDGVLSPFGVVVLRLWIGKLLP
jgi:hypothetical protein